MNTSLKSYCGFVIAIVVILMITAMPAFAVETVTFQDSYGSTVGGEFKTTPSDFGFTPYNLGEFAGFETFMVETNEHIRFNSTFYVQFSNCAVNGGVGGQEPPGSNSDPLDPMTAYLYTQFITGSLTDYDYVTGADRIASADALQYAIWYIEGEITDSLTGLAKTFYDDAYYVVHTSQTWQGLGNVQVMNVFIDPDYTMNREDALVMFPASSTILLTALNGGDVLTGGIIYTMNWSSTGSINDVLIEYSSDNGQAWSTVNIVPNTGSYNWLVPTINSDQCLVRVSHAINPDVNDISDGVFTISHNTLPVINNVIAVQRNDNSKLVDIYYDLADADGDLCTVWVQVSDDGGSTWGVAATYFTGDVGSGIAQGIDKHIVWDCKTDLPGEYGTNYQVKITADDGVPDGPAGMVFVYINDPGVSGHEPFNGEMSKYETTNAQYCEFLNAALASGDITVISNSVYGANGSNGGADFVGEKYFDTYAASSWSQIIYSDGVFSVRSRDGYDMSNHPVVEVSWYGATAFCNYYGYRLPTEWEWQAVADYDGSYTYGCGTTINQSKANYYDNGFANPLGLSSEPYTSPVDYYPSFGYGMNDMAGNVDEWTDSIYSSNSRVNRGGGWYFGAEVSCTVSSRNSGGPGGSNYGLGFRASRDSGSAGGQGSAESGLFSIANRDIWYVDDDAPGDPGPGDPSLSDPLEDGSAGHPFDAIQEAIDFAVDGDTVIVLDGTFTGSGNRDIDFYGLAITVRSTDPEDSNVVAATIIDCQKKGRGFHFHSGEESNSILAGFTITNGLGPNDFDPGGAGFSVGGAISCRSSSPTITRCTLIKNNAGFGGGGISCLHGSNVTVTYCSFFYNTSGMGGALFDGVGMVSNNLFIGNIARRGGALCACNGNVSNNTIIGNKAAQDGGGLLWCYGTITQCIVWGNTAPLGPQLESSSVPNYSCIQDWGGGGVGNITADPCFVNIDSNDFHLLTDSPCIDAGDPNYVAEPNETDLDGNPRIIGDAIDMGAYEYQHVRLPDLEVTSEDIDFVPLPGEPCEPATISATIWNFGWTTVENVTVIFKDFDDTIGSVTIPSIPPGDTRTISIEYTWYEASFRLITVTADPCDIIGELDENNNSGSKIYQVGDVPEMDASIVVSCSAPAGFPESATATIGGEAIYDILVSGQPSFEYPVKGGSVSVQVLDSNGVQLELLDYFTDVEGQFNLSFPVPGQVGDKFEVVIAVTDGTLTGTLRRSFDVIEWRDIYIYSNDITFSDSNPDVDEMITIGATIHADSHNTYIEQNVPVTFWEYPPTGGKYQIGQTQYTGQMTPGTSKFVSVDASFPAEGEYYIQVELGPNFSDDKNLNNRAVRRLTVGPPSPTPPPPPPTEPVKFDLWVYSEDIALSDVNPDLGETINIGALIHAKSDNTHTEPNVPVTFYAHHGTGETYKIGRTQYTGTIEPNDEWAVSTTWRNAAEGVYIIEVVLGSGFSDDNNGNNQATREITVGNRPPDANAGPDQTVECACNTEQGTKVTLDGTGSSDPDGDPLTYTWTGPFVESPAHGPTPTVTLSDGCPGDYETTLVVNDGMVDSEPDDILITVEDTVPPEIVCPADITIECGQSTDPEQVGEATALDDCDTSPDITYSDLSSGTCPEVIVRTWTATDTSGNSSSCEHVITVDDTTPPVINCPPDLTVECDGSDNTTELNAWLAGTTATDVCGSVTLSDDFSGLSDGCGGTGSVTVTWTAVDNCGNTSSCSATFTIVDTTQPMIVTPASNLTVECDGSGNITERNDWLNNHGGAVATDICGNITWSNDFTGLSDDCGATGSATVIFTVTDECGNSSPTTATFTIIDTTPPILTTIPEDKTVYRDGNGNEDEFSEWLASEVEATDGCGDVSISNDFTSFPYECGKTGSVTVTWTAEDDCGNTDTTSATFTIEDPTASVTYDGDLLLTTAGAVTVDTKLVATLRDDAGNLLDIDGEIVTFTLTAEGVGTIIETASTVDGVASTILPLEPAIYMTKVTLGCLDFTTSAIIVIYNPQGGFASGGGWLMPADDGLNTHPNVKAHFGFNVEYTGSSDDPNGSLEFHYQDSYVNLESTLIDRLVVTGGKIAQFKGWAIVNGVPGNWFFVKAIDNGSPGKDNDIFEIKIWFPGVDPEGDPSDRAGGVINAGNIIVHAKN